MKKAEAAPDEVLAVGLDHEGESVALWNAKTGAPLAPSIVWQDRRTALLAEWHRAVERAKGWRT